MTDNEIMKALECCVLGYCRGCFYGETDQRHCKDDLMTNALALINRQKAEIEALQMDNQQLQSDIVNANMNADHALAEIERLRKGVAELADESDARDIDEYNMVCRVRAEAVKEFAERLKEQMTREYYSDYAVDRTLKEMVGEQNG